MIIFLTVVYAVSLGYLILKIFEFNKHIDDYHYKVVKDYSTIHTKIEELNVKFVTTFAQLDKRLEKLSNFEHVDFLIGNVSDEISQLEMDIHTSKQEILDCYSKQALEIQKTKEINALSSKKTFDSLKKAFSRPTVIREDD